MIIPENIVIVVGITLLVSILANAYLIGTLAYREESNHKTTNAAFEAMRQQVKERRAKRDSQKTSGQRTNDFKE